MIATQVLYLYTEKVNYLNAFMAEIEASCDICAENCDGSSSGFISYKQYGPIVVR